MDDAQLYGIIGAVDDNADRRFRHNAFRVQLMLRYFLLFKQFAQPLTDRLIVPSRLEFYVIMR